MKDKYFGIIGLTIICSLCIVFKPEYSQQVILMSVTALVTMVRD